jgi:hypothetical protein
MTFANFDPDREGRGLRPEHHPGIAAEWRFQGFTLASVAREWRIAEPVVRQYADCARVVLQRRPNGAWQISAASLLRLRRLLDGAVRRRDASTPGE